MIEKEQELMAEILDLFAQKFGERAILRGGMVLCLLGSARLTNDLDYIFVPYTSKKNIVDEIVIVLNTIEGVSLKHSMNSKCLRLVVTRASTTVQVEAKVAMDAKVATASTRLFSPKYRFPPRLIHVVDYPEALANKMAAWNERRLVRDVYDIWFYRKMNIQPDAEILLKRLSKPLYSKLVKKNDYFKGKTNNDFYDFLREKINVLSDQDIEREMASYLAPDEIPGLAMEIRASLVRLNR